MKKKTKKQSPYREDRGFTLLEYCAGATVILVTVWGALNFMGTSLQGLLQSIGTWATVRASDIAGAPGVGNGGQGSNTPG